MMPSPTVMSVLPISQPASPFLSPSHVTRLSLSSQSSSPAAARSSSSSQPRRTTSQQQYTPTSTALSSASPPLSVGSEEDAEYNRKHNDFYDRIRDATMTQHKLKALVTEAIARQSDEQLRLIISSAFASHHLVTIKVSQPIVRQATQNATASTPRSSHDSSQRLSATQVLEQESAAAPVQVDDNGASMMAKRSTIVRIMMNTILNTDTILASAVETTFFDVMINHKVHCATKQYSQLIARIIQSLPNMKHRQIGVIELLPSTLHRLRQIFAAGEEIDMTGIGESEGALTYTEFEDWYILHMTKQTLRWSRDSLLPLILTLDKSALTRDHLHALLNKLFAELPVAVTDDLPNIIYNILLIKQADSAILLSSIIHFIHSLDQHYGVHDQTAEMIKQSHSTNNAVSIQLSQSLSQPPSIAAHTRGRQQTLMNESTILLYFHFVFSQDSALGTDLLTLIQSHTLDLTPYTIAILLSMARIQRFQDKIMNILYNIISDELHYQYKLNHSLYISRTLHDTLPLFSSVISILQAAIIHCISVFDQSTLHTTVLLGFKLLNTKLPTSSSSSSSSSSTTLSSSLYPVVDTMCFSNWSFDIDTINFSPDINLIRFGASILRDAFITKEVVRKEIFTYILDRISTAQLMSIALPSIIILRDLILNYSHLFDRHKLNAINESLCDFMTLPTDVSIAYMFAIIPLIHRHQHFTNDILLTLKKSMAHPSQNARITTVIASLMLIDAVMTTGADDDNIMLSQTRARGGRMSMMSSQSQYQLCEEIIGYIRRALTQDALVRSALYSAIIDIFSKHPTIRSLIINELLLPHLTEYHKAATARMPVDLSKCLDTDANVLEPLHHLLQCAFQCIRIVLLNESRDGEAGDEEENNNMIQPLINTFDDITQRFCRYHIQDLQVNRAVESITPAERMRYEMLHGVLQVILDYSMKDHHIYNNNTNINTDDFNNNINNNDLSSSWKIFQDIFQLYYTLHIWLSGEKIITDKEKTANNKRTKKKRKIDAADGEEDRPNDDDEAAGEYDENDDMMIEEEGRRPWTTPNAKGKSKSSNTTTKKKKTSEERFKLKKTNNENKSNKPNDNNNNNKKNKSNNTKEINNNNNNKSQSLSLFKLSHILSLECLNILYQSFATKTGEIYDTIINSIALQRFMAHTLIETIERYALFDLELYYHLDPTISYTTHIIKSIGKILLRHLLHSFHIFKESGEAPYCSKKYHSLMLMHLEALNIAVISTIRHGGVALLSDLTPIMLPPKLATHARQHVTDNPSFAIMELLKRVAQVCDTFMTAPAPMEAQQTLSLMNALIKLDTTDTSEANSLLRNQLTSCFDQDIMRQVVDDHNLVRSTILFFLDVSHHDLSLKHALAIANDIHTVYGQFDTLSSSKNGHKKIAPSNETDYTIVNRKSASTVTVGLCHYIVSVLTDISWITRQIKQLSSLYDTAYSHRILNQRCKQLTTLRSQYESACFNRLYSLIAVLQPLTQTSFVGIEGETVLRTFSQYYKNVSNVIRVLQQAKNKRPAPSGLARLCLAINAQLTYSLHELLAHLQSTDRLVNPSKPTKSAQSKGTSAAQIQRELNVHPDVIHAIDVYESLIISYTESSGGTDLTKNIHRSRGRDFKIDTQSIRRKDRQNTNDGDDEDEEEAGQYDEEGEREEYDGDADGDAHADDAIRNENAASDRLAETDPSPPTLDHMVMAAFGDHDDQDGERIKSE